MARKPTGSPAEPASMFLARHVHAAITSLPGRIAEHPHERPGGIVEANAAFEVRDEEGRKFTVIIARSR